MVDTIAQLIIELKNGNNARKASVSFPYSKFRESVLETLKKAGYVSSISKKGKKVIKTLEVELIYKEGTPKITDVKLVSKRSRRIYVKSDEAHPVRHGFGSMIISTPSGILTDYEARKQKVGGEALFKIW